MEEQVLQQEPTTMNETMAAEIDRRVREQVDRARTEWETASAQADEERERMAAMSEDERLRYALSRREAALAERERQLMERELRAMALERLAERGLPRELADALPYDSEEHCLSGLEALEQSFRRAVQDAVDSRLRGRVPSVGGMRRMDTDAMSDAEYYRMNAQQA